MKGERERMIKRATRFVRDKLIQYHSDSVREIRRTVGIEPRFAGCPKDCHNIDQLDCYWTRELVLDIRSLVHKGKYVLVCFKPGEIKILDSDYLEAVKYERGQVERGLIEQMIRRELNETN